MYDSAREAACKFQILWEIHAYRMSEPSDWNRLRKIKHLCPNMVFVDKPLMWYYKNEVTPFVAQEGEKFLECSGRSRLTHRSVGAACIPESPSSPCVVSRSFPNQIG